MNAGHESAISADVRARRRPGVVAPMLLATLVVALAGCRAMPWSESRTTYDRPPTALTITDDGPPDTYGRPIIVLGSFENPPRAAVNWPDIGEGLGEAMTRRLMNDPAGGVDIWHNPEIADLAAAALRLDGPGRTRALQAIKERHPRVDFVVTGKVTDFLHTAALAKNVRRTRLFGPTNEALSAIDLTVVELESGRIVLTDHVLGRARADGDAASTYEALTIDSYVFWSSPLGKASVEAIDTGAAHIRAALPARVDEIRITRRTDDHRVDIYGGHRGLLEAGQVYFVCQRDWRTGALTPVRDPDLRRPLKARIDRVKSRTASAWLLGRPGPEVDLRGAILTRTLPDPSAPSEKPSTPSFASADGG